MPVPALTGSLVVNAIVTSLGANWSEIPVLIVVLLQIMIGIMIGMQFNREKIKNDKDFSYTKFVSFTMDGSFWISLRLYSIKTSKFRYWNGTL